MHRWTVWTSIVLLAAALVGGTAVLYNLDVRISRGEKLLKEHGTVQRSDYVRVRCDDGRRRIVMRKPGEPVAEYVERVRRIVNGTEEMSGYLCTTLHGCEIVGELEVCTACMVGHDCQDEHDAQVRAFCEEFHCDECR